MSHGEQDEQGTGSGRGRAEGSSPRDVHRVDGEPTPLDHNAQGAADLQTAPEPDDWAGASEGILERSISYQGPLPHSAELSHYESLSPGAATKLIDAHVLERVSAANALTRISRAESFGVSFGAIVSGTLIVGGLAAGIWLALLGETIAAGVFGALPVLSGSATGIISAVKGNGK